MEFLDFIDRTFSFAPDAKDADASSPSSGHAHMPPSSRIFLRHRLQAFSPFYFAPNGPLKSFSKENFAAARSILDSRNERKDFFSETLPAPLPEWFDVSIQDLCDFFSHPTRFLLKKRLGITLSDSRIDLRDKEPFAIEGLDGYAVGQLLLEQFIQGQSRESCCSFLKAKGMLPHGNAGLCAFVKLADEASDFVRNLSFLQLSAHSQTIPINGRLGEFSISGSIDGFSPPFLCRYRFGNKKPKDIITLWMSTLALATFAPDVKSEGGIFAGRDGVCEITGIENASSLLKDALDIYKTGLSRPLPFFPQASWTYAQRMLIKKDSADSALHEAQRVWLGNDYEKGELSDEYLSLCFANDPEHPLDREFCALALKILSPLFEYLRQRNL